MTEAVSCSRRLSGLLVGSSDIHVTVPQILLNGPNPLGCRMRCAGNSFSSPGVLAVLRLIANSNLVVAPCAAADTKLNSGQLWGSC